MRDVKHLLRRFARNTTQGTTAIEYGLIAVLIAVGAPGGHAGAGRWE